MSDDVKSPGGIDGGSGGPPKKKPKKWPPDDSAPAPTPEGGGEEAKAAAPPAAGDDGPARKKPKKWPPDDVAAEAAPKKKPKQWPSATEGEAAKKKPKKWPPDPADAGDAGAAKKKPKTWPPVAAGEGDERAATPAPQPVADKPVWLKDPVAPEWEDASVKPLVAAIREAVPGSVLDAGTYAGDLVVTVARDAIRDVCARVKAEGYRLLVDVCGADYSDREEGRFDVVYVACDLEHDRRVRLKVRTGEGEAVPSVVPVWKGANWLEREIWDMYGVEFSDHPDMTRILLWEGFNGHPLRKDFPVEGIDTGSAIYPEYYEESSGPVAGTGTGWKPPAPAAPETPDSPDDGSTG